MMRMQQLANQLKSMFTNDGNVLLCQYSRRARTCRIVTYSLPTADELNGNGYGDKLYKMSSLLPLNYNRTDP